MKIMRSSLLVLGLLVYCFQGGRAGGQTSQDADRVRIGAGDPFEEWQVTRAENAPNAEELGASARRFFEGASAFLIKETAEQDGKIRFRAVSYMTADALRTEMYQPDGSLYAAVGWLEGTAYEFRPEMSMPDGSTFEQILVQSRGLPWAEIPYPMLFPFGDGCQVGDLFQSWIARTEQEIRVELIVRWLRESSVIGESTVAGRACWVADRNITASSDDHGNTVLGNRYFVDKDTGRLMLWIATQTSASNRTARVHHYEKIEVLPASPSVDWRLRDLPAGDPTFTKEDKDENREHGRDIDDAHGDGISRPGSGD